jgi:hypothetical protein
MAGDEDMAGDERESWREQRRVAAAEHAAAFERRRAAESEQADRLVAEFARAARERGLRTSPLVARGYHGRGRYRTGLHGWYLRRDRSLAVGTDGSFYVLSVPPSLRARLAGASLEPQRPKLVVGEGGRDGESMPLAELLRQRLDAGDRWPGPR